MGEASNSAKMAQRAKNVQLDFKPLLAKLFEVKLGCLMLVLLTCIRVHKQALQLIARADIVSLAPA